MPNGTSQTCRIYQQTDIPEATHNLSELPVHRQPSVVYLKTILVGAKESGLPMQYQEYLAKIKHNGYDGEVAIPVKFEKPKWYISDYFLMFLYLCHLIVCDILLNAIRL